MPTLAILETDTPFPSVKAKYGSYGAIFERLLRKHGELPDDWTIEYYDVVTKQEYPSIDKIDAILITGSKFSAYDDTEWIVKLVDYVRQALDKKSQPNAIRIIGICFGHQILGRALNAKLGVNENGWELSSTKVSLTDTGKKVFGTTRDELDIMQMHRDAVLETPQDTELLASSAKCGVHGFYKRGSVLTLQGHPEFDDFIESELIHSRHELGLFDEDLAEDALVRLKNNNDGPFIAGALVKFISGSEL